MSVINFSLFMSLVKNRDSMSPLAELVNESVVVNMFFSSAVGRMSSWKDIDFFFFFVPLLQEFWKEMGEMGLLGITASGETSGEVYPVNMFVYSQVQTESWGDTCWCKKLADVQRRSGDVCKSVHISPSTGEDSVSLN